MKAGIFTQAIRTREFAAVADWFAIYFFLLGAACIFLAALAALASGGWTTGIRVFSFGLLLFGACSISGWLLGLLFGIPRTLARAQSPQPQANSGTATVAAPQGTRVNTNLEDVSDWLTKTLIGVGLTQLYLVPGYIWRASGALNHYGFAWKDSGQLLALSVFMYAFCGGFWLGYIATRTALTKLLDGLEGADDFAVEISLAADQLLLEVSGKSILPSKSEEVTTADTALLRIPIFKLSSARQLAAWGAAQARSGDLDAAAVALQQAKLSDPGEVKYKEALGKIYAARGDFDLADRLLRSVPNSETGMLAALYVDTKEGAQRALEIGKSLAGDPAANKSLNLHVWLACAYGQLHKWAGKEGKKDDAEAARQSVVDEVKQALAIDPSSKKWLRSLWKPEGSKDDDLESIPDDDKDLTALLEEPPPPARP
ncbi:hypothetical protein [Bosea sp. 685]|uniref:tetratricopeptide repeat protein n=1 Tax=Bosea sp. 685 TaxID=3080057 RepID=UPI002893508F|nr:hypothetical protein [Bosea sp. 685]WNJ89586.1 hypothetical protein RMR04_24765 [Bosea sp. 685]